MGNRRVARDRSRSLLWVSITVLLLFTLQTAKSADDGSAAVVITNLAGGVSVARQTQPISVRVGDKLALPAAIRTGADGTVELRQNRTTVTIAANTAVEVPVTGLGNGKIDRIIQTSGSVFYRVEKREAQKLRVETPYLVAVIKGTQFNVVVQPNSATVALFEGALQIASPDGTDIVDLNAGEIAIRYGSEPRIRVLRMDTGQTLRAAVATPSTSVAAVANAVAAVPVVNGFVGALPNSSNGAVGAGVNAGVAASAVGTNVGINSTVNLGRSAVDLNSGLNVGAGATNADVNVSSTLELNNGVALGANVDAGLGSNTVLGVNADLNAGGSAVTTGASLGVANNAVNANAGLNLSSTPDVAVGVTAPIGGNVSVGVTTAPITTPISNIVTPIVAPVVTPTSTPGSASAPGGLLDNLNTLLGPR